MPHDAPALTVAPESAALLSTAQYPPDHSPAMVYLSSLAPTGRRAIAGRLRHVARLLGHEDYLSVPWHLLRYQHVAAIRSRLQELHLAPATVNMTLSALRGVARAAFNLELMGADDYQRVRNVGPVRCERLPAGRCVSQGELGALLSACTCVGGPGGVRDAAMVALMYAAGGLRRSEIVALDRADYDRRSGSLTVRGKGAKERIVYAENGAAAALDDWLQVRGDQPGPLFLPVNRGGTVQWRRLSDRAVYAMLRKRSEQAGVQELTPHDLRRSFVSDLLDAGADISTVSKLAGHASVQTSARYDRRGEEAKRRATGLLHVPYRRGG